MADFKKLKEFMRLRRETVEKEKREDRVERGLSPVKKKRSKEEIKKITKLLNTKRFSDFDFKKAREED